MAADENATVDLLAGTGGTPEGVIAACALKCLDGAIFGRFWRRATTPSARRRSTRGYDVDRVLTIDDLVAGNYVFFAATARHRAASCCAGCATRRGACSRSRCRCARSPAPFA